MAHLCDMYFNKIYCLQWIYRLTEADQMGQKKSYTKKWGYSFVGEIQSLPNYILYSSHVTKMTIISNRELVIFVGKEI